MQVRYHNQDKSGNLVSLYGGGESMADLTLTEAREFFDYSPETGRLVWRNDHVIRGARAGQEAGIVKITRRNVMYRAVRIKGSYVPAARIAWLLHYGAWPVGNVKYADRDWSNLRIANLVLARFPRMVDADGKQRTSPEAHRHAALRRDFGITADDYDAMLAAQGGVCAICEKAEGRVSRGRVQMMCVDHDHDTGEIRGVLCHKCNVVLGMAGDSAEMLRRAADYLDHHKPQRQVA